MKLPALSLLHAAALALLVAGPARAANVTPTADLADWACTGACGSTAPAGDVSASPTGNARIGYVTTFGAQASGVSPIALSSNSTASGSETNGSSYLSGSFAAAQGDQLAMHFNYVSTDGKGYDDYAWARVVNAADNALVAWLFTARSTNGGTKNVVPGDVLDKDVFDPREVIVDYKSDFDFTSKTSDDPVDFSVLGSSNGTCWRDNAPGCGYTGWLESRMTFAAAGNYRIELGVTNWGDEAYDSALAFDYAGLTATAPVPEPGTLPLMAAALGLLAVLHRRARPA